MRVVLLPVVALIGAVTCGCVRETDRAQESARRFLSALNAGDVSSMQAVATKAARPHIAELFKDSKAEPKGFTLQPAQIDGESARVPVTLEKNQGEVLLRREEGEWRVYALRFEVSADNAFTLDLEHPEAMVGEVFGVLGKEFGKGLEQAGRALGAAMGGFMKGFAEGVKQSAPSPEPSGDRQN